MKFNQNHTDKNQNINEANSSKNSKTSSKGHNKSPTCKTPTETSEDLGKEFVLIVSGEDQLTKNSQNIVKCQEEHEAKLQHSFKNSGDLTSYK